MNLNPLSLFGWIYKRLTLANSLFGFFIQVFNFAGIFVLLVGKIFPGVSEINLFVFVFFCLIVGMMVSSFVIFDVWRFQTVLQDKDVELNDYYISKLSPFQLRTQLVNVLLCDAIVRKDRKEIARLRKIIESGFLDYDEIIKAK